MFFLQTQRLYLSTIPKSVLSERLVRESFHAEIALPKQQITIEFSPEWPGDAIVFFPSMAQKTEAELQADWGGMIVTKDTKKAIGSLGCIGSVSENGSIEIGYGLNISEWRQGYMTEAVKIFSDWLLDQPGVRCVTANCLAANIGSVRVLEKSGFIKMGEHLGAEDSDESGEPMYSWAKP
jgi:[ribosomal protein S5]-alanine N-acetyltransferase